MEIGSGEVAIRETAAPFPAFGRSALALLALALLCDLSALDRKVAAYFFDPALGEFPARHAFWAEEGLHRGGIWLVALVALSTLALLIASLRVARLRPYRREAAYVLACIALSTGSVAILKQSTNVDCPWDVSDYGGSNTYAHVFQAKPEGSVPNHCFPGAHSSGGFSLLAIAFVLAARRHRHARAVLLAGFALGLGYAVTQWARGAHFPSHDLWSAVVAWSVSSLLARAMLLSRAWPAFIEQESDKPRVGGAQAPTGARNTTPVSGFKAPVGADAPPTVCSTTTARFALIAPASKALRRSGPCPRQFAVLLLALPIFYPHPAEASETPLIREIVFRGNDVTLPEVMLREMSIAPGQPADDDAIERSRQSIQNLGLFRSVKATQEPFDGGVRVVFTVREKWYLLPYPRLSANTDGQNSVGAELRWNNIGGRNQSLRALVSSSDRQDEGRGRQLSFLASYRVPFVFDSPYTLDFSGSHATTPVEPEFEGMPEYDESIDEAQFVVSRKFGLKGAASQGWNAGSGLLWRHEDTSGVGAPDPYGDAYAALAQIGYKHVQDRIHSETGTRFSTRFEIADQKQGSDYRYSRLTANYKRSIALGSLPHQTLEWGAELGNSNNGPPNKEWDFSLGGTNGLRGYQRNSFQGDFYYLASATYLRPLHWDWLRLVAGVEAGNIYADADQVNTQVRWSFNAGLRVRATWLVNIEFDAGIALPLDDDSGRIYGSRSGF
ncbi:MAG: phosphatase PAP2 family protein [Panacagrimonas sp.]